MPDDRTTRSLHEIASDTLRCALSWDQEAKLIGNVTAREIARLAVASESFSACPSCGAEPWVNIDCQLCEVAAGLEAESNER